MDVIRFYKETDEYGFLSNSSPHPVEIDGRVWQTTEHYFQAQKYAGTSHEEAVFHALTPVAAKRIGSQRDRPLREHWDDLRNVVMFRAVYAKFTQHEDLREALLATGNAILVEHTPRDAYWGDGGDGSGQDMLGKTLMIVRELLRNRPG